MQQPSFQKWGFARAKHQGPWCSLFLQWTPCWWPGSVNRDIFAKVKVHVAGGGPVNLASCMFKRLSRSDPWFSGVIWQVVNEFSHEMLLANIGPTKDKHGVRESFAKVTFSFAKHGRFRIKEFWSTANYLSPMPSTIFKSGLLGSFLVWDDEDTQRMLIGRVCFWVYHMNHGEKKTLESLYIMYMSSSTGL